MSKAHVFVDLDNTLIHQEHCSDADPCNYPSIEVEEYRVVVHPETLEFLSKLREQYDVTILTAGWSVHQRRVGVAIGVDKAIEVIGRDLRPRWEGGNNWCLFDDAPWGTDAITNKIIKITEMRVVEEGIDIEPRKVAQWKSHYIQAPGFVSWQDSPSSLLLRIPLIEESLRRGSGSAKRRN